MKYKDLLTSEMYWLAQQKDTVFIGQGITKGDRIYNTLKDVPINKCIEMPIAENLIMGVANGLAIKGYRPIVIFQRMDFMLIAADQIINHTALIEKMSNKQFKCPVIIRACIGSQKMEFDCGAQHTHDFTHIFSPYIKVWDFHHKGIDVKIEHTYQDAYNLKEPVMIVEERDRYEEETAPTMPSKN
jgi:pyruvate dehydrogenase E1 component beta subunit